MPLLDRIESRIDADEDDFETLAQEVGKGLRRIDAAIAVSHVRSWEILPDPTMPPARRLVIAGSFAG